MNRYATLGVWVCIPLLLVGCWSASALGASKPNIVFMMADDAGYNEFGFTNTLNHTNSPFQTPNIDALAQQSVIATQAYAAAPLCAASRAGLLTGQYQQRYGFEENLSNSPGALTTTPGLVAEEITVAQRLKDLGYSTGMVGKWHVGYYQGLNRPLDKGFDEFYGLLSGQRTSYFSNSSTQFYQEGAIRRGNDYHEIQFRTEGDSSLYDPVNGRYVTDAFGEEAADFVTRHASDTNPFFLYVPFIAPHDPMDYKQSDWDHFSGVSDPTLHKMVAMTYALDRAVGMVVDRLKDPNHDGNQSDSVLENTIVIFTNDNGGALVPPSFAVNHDNTPYRGWKGFTWEGGIRVPFTISGPGLQPGTTYNGPITFYDMLPTLVNAAGGDASQIPTDGYDMMPNLKGESAVDPHGTMYWRSFDAFAVRDGKWKLTSGYQGNNPGYFIFLYDLSVDPGESNIPPFPSANSRPDIVAPMLRELTNWEATLEKPKWGPNGLLNQNLFDHFVFRVGQSSTTNWSTAGAWLQGGTANIKTLLPQDAYANAILEFPIRNDADYTANNDMDRMAKQQAFMLNEMRLTGQFNGALGRQGAITGKRLLLLKTLDGQMPRIRLDATATSTPASFTFNIGNELDLLDNLEITGDGTQNFVISGPIIDYWDPRSVTKTGSSQVTLTNNNTFKGTLTVNGGTMRINGPNAAISGAAGIVVGSTGTLAVQNGGFVAAGSAKIDGNAAMTVSGVYVAPAPPRRSTLQVPAAISIGDSAVGNSALTIADGGLVTSASGFIGRQSGSSGTVSVGGMSVAGNLAATWNNAGPLAVGGDAGQAGGSGALGVQTGGVVNVGQALTIWNEGAVNLSGGTINVAELVFAGGTFDFDFGQLGFTTAQQIETGGPIETALGGTLAIGAGRHLAVAGRATLTTPLTIAGGTFSAGELVNGQFLVFDAGTLNITTADVVVGPGGLLETLSTLGAGRHLHVTHQTTVTAVARLTVADGASLSAGTLQNLGEVQLAGASAVVGGTTFQNAGLLRGVGRVDAAVTNSGSIEAFEQPGEMIFNAPVSNLADGLIAVRNSVVRYAQGLANQGQLSYGPGTLDTFGDLDNDGGTIGLGAGARVSVIGDLAQNGTLNLVGDSHLTVYGDFTGSGGTSGPGTLEVLGTLSVGNSPAEAHFGGDLLLGGGASTRIELAGKNNGQFDRLVVTGQAFLDGNLVVLLQNGFSPAAIDTFTIITAGSLLSGEFDNTTNGGRLNVFGSEGSFLVTYDLSNRSVVLSHFALAPHPGDFNNDQTVDAADYVVWRNGLGTTYTPADYDVWRAHFGQTVGSGAGVTGAHAAVSEPTTPLVLVAGILTMCARRRVRCRQFMGHSEKVRMGFWFGSWLVASQNRSADEL